MKLTAEYWIKYINTHTSANKAAERRMERYIAGHGIDDMDKLADYAYALVSKYGEAASALSCEMYDQMARAQRVNVPEAIPAETASYGEVASAVRGAGKRSPSLIPDAVGRLVKQAGADTTLQNAKRDNAYFAWVAHGDTCPYCMALAGLGWQRAGKLTLEGGHAEHIHANCDCEYAIDLKGDLEIDGYDPYEINQQLLDMTDGEFDADSLIRMSGRNAKGRDHGALNIVRRKQYAANKDHINTQKREAYAARKNYEKATLGFKNGKGHGTIPLGSDEEAGAPRVPNAITAATVQDKIQKYLLNSNHRVGKHKARVINSVLGFNYQNWEELSDQMFDKLQTSGYTEKSETRYGTKYVVPMRIEGKKGKSMVLNTVWQIDKGSNIPRFITSTFDLKTVRKK